MITVEVYLDSAITGKRTRIGRATIVNDGKCKHHPQRGDYECYIKGKRRLINVRVENFPRKSRDVWELLRRALNTPKR